MEEITPFNDIKINSELVKSWDFISFESTRLYYRSTPENSGFHFCSLRWVSHGPDSDNWNEETLAEVICSGWAAFDGIRHLNFGDEQTDNVGYFNYPDIEVFIWVMQQLKELQHKYCSDFK